MSEIKHTPGPWTANPLDSDAESNLIFASTLANGTRRLVASVTTGADAPANRRLIAAAPELLDATQTALSALESIANEMTVGDRFTNAGQLLLDALEPCRAAVAKATGSQS